MGGPTEIESIAIIQSLITLEVLATSDSDLSQLDKALATN